MPNFADFRGSDEYIYFWEEEKPIGIAGLCTLKSAMIYYIDNSPWKIVQLYSTKHNAV